MQRQELELAGDIGKHSQSQRNYERNLAELTPELWRVSNCEELVGFYFREMMGLVWGGYCSKYSPLTYFPMMFPFGS